MSAFNNKQNNQIDKTTVQVKLSENPLTKSIFDEIDIFSEVESEINPKELIEKGKAGSTESDNIQESIDNYAQYIITEGIGEGIENVTTKIFSGVYQLLANALGKIRVYTYTRIT